MTEIGCTEVRWRKRSPYTVKKISPVLVKQESEPLLPLPERCSRVRGEEALDKWLRGEVVLVVEFLLSELLKPAWAIFSHPWHGSGPKYLSMHTLGDMVLDKRSSFSANWSTFLPPSYLPDCDPLDATSNPRGSMNSEASDAGYSSVHEPPSWLCSTGYKFLKHPLNHILHQFYHRKEVKTHFTNPSSGCLMLQHILHSRLSQIALIG